MRANEKFVRQEKEIIMKNNFLLISNFQNPISQQTNNIIPNFLGNFQTM